MSTTKQFDEKMIALSDEYRQGALQINATSPYIHSEYERYSSLQKAALLLAFDGDQDAADAVYGHTISSGESAAWLVKTYPTEYLKNEPHGI